jgi:hypothetical protein
MRLAAALLGLFLATNAQAAGQSKGAKALAPKPPERVGTIVKLDPEAGGLCKPLVDRLSLCLVDATGGKPGRTLQAVDGSWEQLAGRVPAERLVGQLPEREVQGVGRYAMSNLGDGLDHAALLAPEALARRFGEDLRVAMPDSRTLLVWGQGSYELDKMLAVGALLMQEAAARGVNPEPADKRPPASAVSPTVLRWDGRSWQVHGAASERPG